MAAKFDFTRGTRYRVERPDGSYCEGIGDDYDAELGTLVLGRVQSFDAQGRSVAIVPARSLEFDLAREKASKVEKG